jgi:hypothetical protein
MKMRALPSSTALSGEVRSPTRYRAGHLAQLQDAYGRLARGMYSMLAVRRVFRFRVVLHAQGSRWIHPTSIPGERETAYVCAPHTHDAVPSPMRPRSPPIAACEEKTKTRRESCYLHGPTL